jgi:hypothetical protein
MIEKYKDLPHPESWEIETFHRVLQERGVTKGQIDYWVDNCDPGNTQNPVKYKVDRNYSLVDIDSGKGELELRFRE